MVCMGQYFVWRVDYAFRKAVPDGVKGVDKRSFLQRRMMYYEAMVKMAVRLGWTGSVPL